MREANQHTCTVNMGALSDDCIHQSNKILGNTGKLISSPSEVPSIYSFSEYFVV